MQHDLNVPPFVLASWKDSEVYPENKAALSAMDHELDLKDNLECDTCEITVAAGVTAKDKRAINRGKRTKCVIRGKKKILQTTTVSEPNITGKKHLFIFNRLL